MRDKSSSSVMSDSRSEFLIKEIRSGVLERRLDAISEIRDLIRNNNPITEAVATALGINIINDTNQKARKAAAYALYDIAKLKPSVINKEMIKSLEQAEASERGLRYPDEDRLWSFNKIISKVKTGCVDLKAMPDSIIVNICGDLNSSDHEERKSTALSIKNISAAKPQSIPDWATSSFIQNLNDSDVGIRKLTAETLSNITTTRPAFLTLKVIPALTKNLNDPDDDMKIFVMRTFEHTASRISSYITMDVMLSLIENLNSANDDVRGWAGQLFETIASQNSRLHKEVMSGLARDLASHDEGSRIEAADLLNIVAETIPAFVTDKAVAAIERSLDDANEKVRELAANSIEEITQFQVDLAEKKAKQGSPISVQDIEEMKEMSRVLSPLAGAGSDVINRLTSFGISLEIAAREHEYITNYPKLHKYCSVFSSQMKSVVTAAYSINSRMVADSREYTAEKAVRVINVAASASGVPGASLVAGVASCITKMVADYERRPTIGRVVDAFPADRTDLFIITLARALTLGQQGDIMSLNVKAERSSNSFAKLGRYMTKPFGQAEVTVESLAVSQSAILIEKIMNTDSLIIEDNSRHIAKLAEWAKSRDIEGMKSVNDNSVAKGLYSANVIESKMPDESKGRSFLSFGRK